RRRRRRRGRRLRARPLIHDVALRDPAVAGAPRDLCRVDALLFDELPRRGASPPIGARGFRGRGGGAAGPRRGRAGRRRGGGGAGGGAAAAVPFASVSIDPITSPETTVPPSPLATFTRTPSAGAGSSRTTLSVSMSIRFSSRLTASPSRLCHASSVASAT